MKKILVIVKKSIFYILRREFIMKKELEKSLKRYLKRKVRITLGFVTAFAIMGNVGLANSTTDYELAEKYLNGIENTKLDEKS